MLKIIFVNGKEIEFNDNEYIEAYMYENKLQVDMKTTTIYFPLYNILSYQIDEPAKEQRPKRTINIYGVERVVPDCYTDKNDHYRERPWGAGIAGGAGIAQCAKSNRCELSHSCTKEKGYLF